MLGQTIDSKYEVLRLLGQGGMGAVYEARNTSTGRRVAVKVITGDLLQKNALAVKRFQREAKAAGAIDTQHIAQALDAGTDAATGAPYLVMEYLKGEDLQQLLKRVGPLPPDVALKIVAQACVGLGKAHEARVIHRDIKPANLFLAQQEQGEILVKILDFGIAKIKPDEATDAETTGLTRTGGMIGSPLYMSPEQARGSKEIDFRTDLWSLGVVLYHALAGRAPHADIDAFGELIMALCSEAPRPVQRLAPWVPKEVAAVVHGALRITPGQRYPSAAAMLDAMRPLLDGGFTLREPDLVGLTAEQRSDVAPTLELTTADASPVTQAPPRARSKTPIVAGAAMVALGLGALAGGYWWPRETPPEVRPRPSLIGESSSAAPRPSQAPMPPPREPPPPPEQRVTLQVSPSDASVEIEGVAVPVKNGVVEITGPPGSVRQLRLFKGKRESKATVVITEGGALPSKLELEPSRPAQDGGAKPGASSHVGASVLTPDAFQ